VLERLAEGALTLTAVTLLAPHLTTESHGDVLDAARGRSKRDVETIVARLHPRPDVPPSVRKLPTPKVAVVTSPPAVAEERTSTAAPASPPPVLIPVAVPAPRPAVVTPIAPARYKVQVTISAETQAKLQRVQDLMRHRVPNGDLAVIFDRALTVLLAELERTKLAATTRPRTAAGAQHARAASPDAHRPTAAAPPRSTGSTPAASTDRRRAPPGSRHIPASVKRAIWVRDGGQCTYLGNSQRCEERGGLEFHHVVPYAAGGTASVDNTRLLCKAHNLYEAERHCTSGLGRSGGDRMRTRPCSSRQLGPDRVDDATAKVRHADGPATGQ
jgi:hypothetical protein